MKNYFMSFDGNGEEDDVFNLLKKRICPDIEKIKPTEYREGRLFLMAQAETEIKGKLHTLNTGIRLGMLIKPERAVIFHRDDSVMIEKSFLVHLGDIKHLQDNIYRAMTADETIFWLELDRMFRETYFLFPHDDQGLKRLWRSRKKNEKEEAAIEDSPKEILIVDDEYRYFRNELETVVKQRYPSWEILWAEDEIHAELFLMENLHLDLVILDLEFRGADIEGMELLQELRGGKDRDFFFPIIVFSRCRDVDIIEELIKPMELGADDYVSKFDILEKNNFNLLVSLMARHMNRYEQVHDMQKILAPDVDCESGEFLFYGKSNPFVEVGGDVTECVQHEDKTTVYLADAISHGFDAALLSGMFKAAIKTKLLESEPLLDCICAVDSVLCRIRKKAEKRLGFVLTTVMLQFKDDNQVEIVNAGHLPVLHYRKDENKIEKITLQKRDRALGMMECGKPRQQVFVNYFPGDLFVLLSDGISETKGRNGEDFDIKGVEEIIIKYRDQPLAEICNRVFEAVRRHGRQTDDRTLMLVRVKD